MNKNKIMIAVFILFLFFILSLIISLDKTTMPKLGINIYKAIPNFKYFNLISNSKSDDGLIETIELKKDNVIIKIKSIKKIENGTSEDYKNYKLNMINSTFETIKSPYPGRISLDIVCPEEFKLSRVNTPDPDSTYYIIYATSRYSYGACSWDSIEYRVILLFRYCEDRKELHQVEFFIPIDKFNASYLEMAEKIKCT